MSFAVSQPLYNPKPGKLTSKKKAPAKLTSREQELCLQLAAILVKQVRLKAASNSLKK